VRNRAFRLLHLAAIGFVTIETVLGYACPLTIWEDVLRPRGRDSAASSAAGSRTFFTTIFPEWVFATAYCAFALAVIWAWWAIPPRARSSRPDIAL